MRIRRPRTLPCRTLQTTVVEAPAPAPAVALLDGTDMPIRAFRGGWLLVNYWAEWCAPAWRNSELNHLRLIRGGVRARDRFDRLEPEVMRPQVASLGIGFPVAAGDPTAALGLALPEMLPSTLSSIPPVSRSLFCAGRRRSRICTAPWGAATERAGDAALGEDLSEPSAGTD